VEVPRGTNTHRNRVLLATNHHLASLYYDAHKVPHPVEAARRLKSVLPDLDEADTLRRLQSNARFVWIKRRLSPRQQWQINALGIPGLSFQQESNRFYPQGHLVSHAVGYVDIDNRGQGGLERQFDTALSDPVSPASVRSSIDVRVQHALYSELSASMAKFSSKGAAGVVMDVNTGEVLALVSLPDFDPHHPGDPTQRRHFNYVTQGVYEMGSPFKAFTIAAALENGTVSLGSMYDTTKPIHIGGFTIHDYHPEDRPLSVPEIFLHSSNIGAAKIAVDLGGDDQLAFFRDVGLLTPASIELPEVGMPMIPPVWREVNTMTASYGHGIAVSPLQLASGIAALVNGGLMRQATIISAEGRRLAEPHRVISARVSNEMRDLMRLVVTDGTGGNASAAGYRVGGKTGTAEKLAANGTYARKKLISSFVGMFPTDNPRYLVFAMLDEPHGIKETFGYATGGWTAAPVVSKVVSRIGPILGVYPKGEEHLAPSSPALMASYVGDGR
jgi:cell division protein FtsI (penicillin-binding protein 3)